MFKNLLFIIVTKMHSSSLGALMIFIFKISNDILLLSEIVKFQTGIFRAFIDKINYIFMNHY